MACRYGGKIQVDTHTIERGVYCKWRYDNYAIHIYFPFLITNTRNYLHIMFRDIELRSAAFVEEFLRWASV